MKALNQSQITMFLRCGEQHRRRYIEGEIVPPSIALVRGSSVHKGIEFNARQKIDTRVDLPKKDVVDFAVNEFEARIVSDGLLLTPEEESEGKASIIEGGQKEVISLTGLYADQVAPEYQPIEVEQKYSFTLEGGQEIYGTIDQLDEHEIIPDFKTAARKANVADYDASIQVGLYYLLYHLTKQKPPRQVNVEVLIAKKTPERQQIVQTRTREDYQALLLQISGVARAIESGIVTGAYGTGSWACSAKYCGYHSTCPFVPAHKRGKE